jgi:branched-chain amino acid aminotransferase
MSPTGSAAEVPPVTSAGPWNFEVGELTLQMRKDYLDLVNRRLSNS